MKQKSQPGKPGAARGRQKADTNVANPLAAGDTFLPHERDQAPGGGDLDGAIASRDPIAQAHRDVSRGLKDTDLRGTPSNVPAPQTGSRNDEDAGQPEKPQRGAVAPRK